MGLKKIAGLTFGIFISCMVLVITANANLIVNGSFEDGDFSGANYSWLTLSPGDLELTGWDIGGDGVDWHNTAEFQPVLYGGKVLDLNLSNFSNTGTLSQTFDTAVGMWYELNFYMTAPKWFSDTPRTVQVDVAGVSETFTTAVSPDNLILSWEKFEYSFLATGIETTLMFSNPNQGGGYWGPVLDNVGVNPVPEPATMLLFGTGLLGLAGASFRRKKK